MGKFYNDSLSPVYDSVAGMVSWFDALEGVSAVVDTYTYTNVEFIGAKITIDNTSIEIFYGFKKSPWETRSNLYYLKNNGTFMAGPIKGENYNGGAEEITVYAYVNASSASEANCIMLNCTSVYSSYTNGFEIVYTKTAEDKYLLGYNSSQINTRYLDVASLTFKDINDTSASYTYTNMFPYIAKAGTIDFTNEAFFVNGNGYRAFSTDLLKECSTVTRLSTQSLSSGNCVALGAHCLAPLDEE